MLNQAQREEYFNHLKRLVYMYGVHEISRHIASQLFPYSLSHFPTEDELDRRPPKYMEWIWEGKAMEVTCFITYSGNLVYRRKSFE